MSELSGAQLRAMALAEAKKHHTKGSKFHVTMPNQACFVDMNDDQLDGLRNHAAEKKLTIFEFSAADLGIAAVEEGEEGKGKNKKK